MRVQNPFAALEDSEPLPDFCVVPLANYQDRHPERALLLIEVSESSLRKDRGVKLGIYAENGVPEYWVVNVKTKTIEVHTDPEGARYRTVHIFERGQTIRPAAFPDLAVSVDEVAW